MEDNKGACRGSVYQGSDELHAFVCTTCDKDGRNVGAVKYCMGCDENLCTQCVKQHDRFAVMKTHQLLDTCVDVNSKKASLPSQRCRIHAGKLFDIYCPAHDAVCCSTCVALEHSSCRGMMYLPDAAKGFKNSEEARQFELDLTHLQPKLSDIRQEIGKHVEDLQKEEEQLLQQIGDFRKKINTHLDVMQNEITNGVKSELKCEKDATNSSIEEVDNTLASLKDQERLLKDLDKENESEMFVQVKTGKRYAAIGFDLLKKFEHLSRGRTGYCLSHDYNVSKIIEESKSLAILSKESNDTAIEFVGDFDIKIPEDKNVPMIGGLCEVNDNEVLVADAANSRIKKLDGNFRVTSYMDLQAGPYSVCYIGDNTVAITMVNAKVQFVLLNKPMVRTMSFDVGERCRGISCINKELYVCSGGHHVDTPGRVEVYDLHGTHLRTYFAHFSMPMNLRDNIASGKIYITDKKQGLIVMDRNFVLQTIIKSQEFENQHGICMVRGTWLCISDYQTNNIALFNWDGKCVKHILSSKDGIDKPMSLCFIPKQHMLIVAMHKTDAIKVFSLIDK